jgi:hypothetical protein
MFGEIQRTGIYTAGNKTYQSGLQRPNFVNKTHQNGVLRPNFVSVNYSVYGRFWKGKDFLSQLCALYVKLPRFSLFLFVFLSIPSICWLFYKDLFETSKLSHFGSLILVFLSFGGLL